MELVPAPTAQLHTAQPAVLLGHGTLGELPGRVQLAGLVVAKLTAEVGRLDEVRRVREVVPLAALRQASIGQLGGPILGALAREV
jgi:hypothetical protein